MKYKELEAKVINWGEERNLYCPENGATVNSQLLKFFTELGELSDAILNEDREKIKDGIGDCIICLIGILKLENGIHRTADITIDSIKISTSNEIKLKRMSEDIGIVINSIADNSFVNTPVAVAGLILLEKIFDFEYCECLEFAYNEIKDRKGKMINGVFVKE